VARWLRPATKHGICNKCDEIDNRAKLNRNDEIHTKEPVKGL